MLASKDAEVERLTRELNYNFLEWNMPWEKALILFRHMLADATFEAQIDDVPPIYDHMTEFRDQEGQKYMGDYAPRGRRMSKEQFLSNFQVKFSIADTKQLN